MTQPPVVAGKQLVGPLDLSDEAYREYEMGPVAARFTYRIDNPKQLFYRLGGTTHRVVDAAGLTHCVPAPVEGGTTILRWQGRSAETAVSF